MIQADAGMSERVMSQMWERFEEIRNRADLNPSERIHLAQLAREAAIAECNVSAVEAQVEGLHIAAEDAQEAFTEAFDSAA